MQGSGSESWGIQNNRTTLGQPSTKGNVFCHNTQHTYHRIGAHILFYHVLTIIAILYCHFMPSKTQGGVDPTKTQFHREQDLNPTGGNRLISFMEGWMWQTCSFSSVGCLYFLFHLRPLTKKQLHSVGGCMCICACFLNISSVSKCTT